MQQSRPIYLPIHQSVALIARDSILATLALGEAVHGDAWLDREDWIDLDHAIDHILAYRAHNDAEDIEHAITRLALLLARRRRL